MVDATQALCRASSLGLRLKVSNKYYSEYARTLLVLDSEKRKRNSVSTMNDLPDITGSPMRTPSPVLFDDDYVPNSPMGVEKSQRLVGSLIAVPETVEYSPYGQAQEIPFPDVVEAVEDMPPPPPPPDIPPLFQDEWADDILVQACQAAEIPTAVEPDDDSESTQPTWLAKPFTLRKQMPAKSFAKVIDGHLHKANYNAKVHKVAAPKLQSVIKPVVKERISRALKAKQTFVNVRAKREPVINHTSTDTVVKVIKDDMFMRVIETVTRVITTTTYFKCQDNTIVID